MISYREGRINILLDFYQIRVKLVLKLIYFIVVLILFMESFMILVPHGPLKKLAKKMRIEMFGHMLPL